MSVTLDVSSDVVGGAVGLVLTVVVYLISGVVFPRLMAKSQFDAVIGGATVELSSRSMASVRNWLGFWALSSTALVKIIALILEFGVLGFSKPVTSDLPAVILGGGPRFSGNYSTGGDLFVHNIQGLPQLFVSATRSCSELTQDEDFKMLKNYYPAFGVDASEASTTMFKALACTSSWVGWAEWTIEPDGNLTVETQSLVEQVAYTAEVVYTWNLGAYYANLTISYGLGTSFRGGQQQQSPVVVVEGTSSNFAISITEEGGHYVYTVSTDMEAQTIGGLDVLTGPFSLGHLRCSEHSLGGVIAFALVSGFPSALADLYESSNIWWESESRSDSDYSALAYNNAEGAEQSWPSLVDSSTGNVYTEYEKQTATVMYPFEVGQKEATLLRGWFIVLAAILGLVVCVLSVGSLLTEKEAGSFWSYDGLSKMAGGSGNPTVFGKVTAEGCNRIGFTGNGA